MQNRRAGYAAPGGEPLTRPTKLETTDPNLEFF